MDIPHIISESKLWQVIAGDTRLANTIVDLRAVAAKIGVKASEVVPDYTDHTVDHMDGLWGVCDSIFTEDEISKFSRADAFVLGGAFYVHDLGMALAATQDGLAKIKSSKEYAAACCQLRAKGPFDARADVLAIRAATRDIHAQVAADLATERVMGLDLFLIESSDLRRLWGGHIG